MEWCLIIQPLHFTEEICLRGVNLLWILLFFSFPPRGAINWGFYVNFLLFNIRNMNQRLLVWDFCKSFLLWFSFIPSANPLYFLGSQGHFLPQKWMTKDLLRESCLHDSLSPQSGSPLVPLQTCAVQQPH